MDKHLRNQISPEPIKLHNVQRYIPSTLSTIDLQLCADDHSALNQWVTGGAFEQQLTECANHCNFSSALHLMLIHDFAARELVPQIVSEQSFARLWCWRTLLTETFAFLLLENAAFVVPHPSNFDVDDGLQLHNESGACLRFNDGFEIFSWHGTILPKNDILNKDTLTVERITGEENAEIRSALINMYGEARFLNDSGANLIHSDECGELYRKTLPDDEPLVMVKVRNSTAEPDGTFRHYFLRVPPTIRTARGAVAWTFGMEPQDYVPLQET